MKSYYWFNRISDASCALKEMEKSSGLDVVPLGGSEPGAYYEIRDSSGNRLGVLDAYVGLMIIEGRGNRCIHSRKTTTECHYLTIRPFCVSRKKSCAHAFSAFMTSR